MSTSSKILMWLLAIWATGIGLRFVISYFTGDWYPYNSGVVDVGNSATFDLFFDWGVLFVLGLINVVIITKDGLISYWRSKKCATH